MAPASDSTEGRRPVLVSACLLGLPARYDGGSKPSEALFAHLEQAGLLAIPVCPEQLAGLPTPRDRTCFRTGSGRDVLDGTGELVSATGKRMNEAFLRGAQATLDIARLTGCTTAILKERSPSCGVHRIWQNDDLIAGEGVTTALLVANGLTVLSEEDL